MDIELPIIAGLVSTGVFAAGTIPMLEKARRTRNLASYSIVNIVLANGGNLIYSVYVLSLPVGPIWLLHGFNLVSSGLMLFWYVKYEGWPPRPAASRDHRGSSPEASGCCPSAA